MPKVKIIGNIKYILGENDYDNHNIIINAKSSWWWYHLNDYVSGHCIVCSDNINENINIIAGNYIKKYSKYKNDNNVKVCYCKVNNLKILDKPGLVEFISKPSIFNCYNTKIYHYSKFKQGHGIYFMNEYNYNCMLSGIYGELKKRKNKKLNEITLNIDNPLIVDNEDMFNDIINRLNCIMNNPNDNIINLCDYINSNLNLNLNLKEIKSQIKIFKSDMKLKKKLMHPFNYILNYYNFNGIYFKNCNYGIYIIKNCNKENKFILIYND